MITQISMPNGLITILDYVCATHTNIASKHNPNFEEKHHCLNFYATTGRIPVEMFMRK